MVRNCLIRAAVASLAFALGLSAAPSAQAGWVAGFTGNTLMTSGTTSGIVDFAVWQTDTTGPNANNWEAQLGVTPTSAAAPAVDTSAAYVYFYEVVNVGTSNYGDLFVNSWATTPYTSGGYLPQTVFQDSSGNAIGPAAKQYLGPTPSGPDQVTNNPSVVASNTTLNTPPSTPAPFVTDVNAIHPLAVTSLGGFGSPGNAADINWANVNLGPPFNINTEQLSAGSYSTVVFLTSDTGPTYSAGSLRENSVAGVIATGGIPTQSPEPATLAMWGLGAIGFGLVARRRKKLRLVSC